MLTRPSEDYEYWSDLERALGEHTLKFEKTEHYYPVLSDIKKHLATYISNEESKYAFNEKHKDKIYKNLMFPEDHLTPAEKNTFLEYRNK